jgi:hypothetical protein|tara:strand:- start:826 stop:1428 length:603 start_codon:yes stop_codon:yes gene_type:complete
MWRAIIKLYNSGCNESAKQMVKRIFEGIIITVFGGLFLALIEYFSEYTPLSSIWRTITFAFYKTWQCFTDSYAVPGYMWVVIIALVTYALSHLIRNFIPYKKLTRKNYTKDTIKGVVWRWSWYFKEPIKLIPYCKTCDLELERYTFTENPSRFSQYTDSVGLECTSCDFSIEFPGHDNVRYPAELAKKEIERRAREKFGE